MSVFLRFLILIAAFTGFAYVFFFKLCPLWEAWGVPPIVEVLIFILVGGAGVFGLERLGFFDDFPDWLRGP